MSVALGVDRGSERVEAIRCRDRLRFARVVRVVDAKGLHVSERVDDRRAAERASVSETRSRYFEASAIFWLVVVFYDVDGVAAIDDVQFSSVQFTVLF